MAVLTAFPASLLSSLRRRRHTIQKPTMTGINQLEGLGPYLVRSLGDFVASRHKGEGRVCIINYHRILASADALFESEPTVATFRWQMELLARNFNVLSLDSMVEALSAGRVPPRAICITFDDGYRSVHDLALPILRALNLPATVFVTTGTLDGGTMWNDTISEAVRCHQGTELDLRAIGLGRFPLATVELRRNAVQRLLDHTKYLTPEGRLVITGAMGRLCGVPAPDLMLTRKMIRTLAENQVDIGGHTITHPILARAPDALACHEIREGKRQLEDIIGRQVRYFAYPNGKPGIDFTPRHVQMVKDAGYAAAFTTVMGPATSRHDRFHLPRSRPWDTSRFLFASRLLAWLAGRAI
jgi:peptidoglycan/xylan/chitin deacetylase (PgdA/CDA1 family)